MKIDAARREQHLAWLLELTQIPTAAGREHRVSQWVRDWAAAREGVSLTQDPSGNLHLAFSETGDDRPLYFTAHLDHPAFVVERIVGPGTLELSFRGGVMADYFKNARIEVVAADDSRLPATLLTRQPRAGVFDFYLAELDGGSEAVAVGDVARWLLPRAEIVDGRLHTDACDDLAAAAAALAAFDELLRLRAAGKKTLDVRLLFTRAEEVGFVGAIAACRSGLIPAGARLIALENSRSFPESPIHGGPIVRVGDRMSIFTPSLTDAVARRAEELAGGPAPTAAQKLAEAPAWKWQRKLMAGGACEASVFCAAGLEATCACLPLGNYHNMGDLTAVQAGTNTRPARIEREFIGIDDYHGLVDLLVGCGERLPPPGAVSERIQKLWTERRFILDERPGT